MKVIKMVLVILITLYSAFLSAGEDLFVLNYNYYVMTGSPENLIETMRKITADKGGYVKYYSNSRLIIRLSSKYSDTLMGYLNEGGYIIDKQVYRRDVSEKMIDLKTRLSAKQKLLQNLYEIFSGSRLEQTLEVEKEVGKVIIQIEKLKGELAYYRDRILLSEITININLKKGTTHKKKAATQWDWIRHLGIENLIIRY